MMGIKDKVHSILETAQEVIGTRTLFVARTGKGMFSVLKVFNRNGSYINDEDSFSIEHSI